MNDLKKFNERMDKALGLIGENRVGSLESEEVSRKNARRSFVAKRYLSKGKKSKVMT